MMTVRGAPAAMSAVRGIARGVLPGDQDQSSSIVFLDPPPFWKATDSDEALVAPPEGVPAAIGKRTVRETTVFEPTRSSEEEDGA